MSWFSSAFTSQNLILAGVGVSLLGSAARAVFTKPKQRANQVSQVLPATRDSLRASNRAAASSSDLSLALSPLIKAPVLSQSPVSDPSNNAQGGA